MRSDVVAFSQAAELFLACGVPKVELDGAVSGVESDIGYFYSLGGDVFFLKFACEMSFDESGFSDSSVSYDDEFELSDWLDSLVLSWIHI